MKTNYTTPELIILDMTAVDVITASGGMEQGGDYDATGNITGDSNWGNLFP